MAKCSICLSVWTNIHRFLEHEYLSQYKSSNIVLLRPSMTFMLLQTADTRSLRDVLPDLSRTTHVFLPVNDCRNVNEAEGGSHWSLLLVSLVDGIAFHYDSLPPGNRDEALLATQKISMLVNRQLSFVHLEDSPVQENSSDCGVFVCLTMRHLLLRRLLMASSAEKISMSLNGMRVDAAGGRKEIVRIIDRLRKKAERRRSYVPPFTFVILVLSVLLSLILAFLPTLLPQLPFSISTYIYIPPHIHICLEDLHCRLSTLSQPYLMYLEDLYNSLSAVSQPYLPYLASMPNLSEYTKHYISPSFLSHSSIPFSIHSSFPIHVPSSLEEVKQITKAWLIRA